MRIPIFKPGTHRASNGVVLTFSEEDLKAIARHYDPQIHESSVVIGHPKTDDPSYAWVESIMYADGELTVDAIQVDPAFAELYTTGRYKKVSPSFYIPGDPANPIGDKGYYLRHVGFLGAQPPAVKGLKPASFSGEGFYLSFDEGPIESAPSAIPATSNVSNDDVKASASEMAALRAENTRLKAEQLAAQKAAMAKANADFAESLIKEGRLLPKSRDLVVSLLNQAPADSAEFGEEGTDKSFIAQFKAFLGEIPQLVDFSEVATKDKAASTAANESVEYAEGVSEISKALDQKIRAYMNANKVDYRTAFEAVK